MTSVELVDVEAIQLVSVRRGKFVNGLVERRVETDVTTLSIKPVVRPL